MNPPKQPKKPSKPNKPSPTVDDSIICRIDELRYDGKSLGATVEEYFPGISLADIVLDADYSFWGDGDYETVLKYHRLAPNLEYDEQMTKYHEKLEKYEEAKRQYLLDVEKYKEDLALWHKEQLEKLNEA